jgi:fumarylacetoacetase
MDGEPTAHALDGTHDPALRSWVAGANDPTGDFPIQNLPLGVFRRRRSEASRVGIAIGDQVLDLRRCRELRLLDGLPPAVVAGAAEAVSLNALLALGPEALRSLRRAVSKFLRADSTLVEPGVLVPMSGAELLLPVDVGDYTDFYASIVHARNVGRLFRPTAPLPRNYRHLPLAYHGRSSSLVVSGTPVKRPCGQRIPEGGEVPSFEPSRRLDYELELGAYVGAGSPPGRPLRLDDAEGHLAGLGLVNDWSARDLQAWEAQPLGPFLSKSFATSVSPWMVTLDALAPYRCRAGRPAADPPPLPHLASARNDARGGIDVTVEAWLQSAAMRRRGLDPVRVSRAAFRDMYWTFAQMVTHHASNGCPLRTGDLLASGTISGPGDDAAGCLLERTGRGAGVLTLPTGEQRSFLADGDEVTLRAHCARDGFVRIGLGSCAARVLPASTGCGVSEPASGR